MKCHPWQRQGHLLPKQRVAGSSPVSRSRYDFGLIDNKITHLVFGGLWPYFSEE
jgi:hypothetical protein